LTSGTENLGEKVSNWLSQQGLSIETLNSPGYLSLFSAQIASSPEESISVSQAINEDRVIIGRSLQLDEKDQKLLSALPAQTRAALKKDLVVLLNGRTPLFRLDEKEGVLDRLSLTQPIYADGLTKDRVMAAISELFKTQALVFLRLGDYLMQAAELVQPSAPQQRASPAQASRIRTSAKSQRGKHVQS